MKKNKLCEVLGIDLPIISGGMVWCSGWRLASAVSREGGLGLIGAGSMHPEVLREHIQKCRIATDKPFGVNVPLMYPEIDKVMDIIKEEKVPVVVTSAGNPKLWTTSLKEAGAKVIHVVSSARFALKAQEAGVDAVVAEGFEAGGHNGREETTTLCLIPEVVRAVSIPVIAAGGIASGQAIFAMQALGALGVQIGSLFALSQESSAHERFKETACSLEEGGTMLSLKKISPTRLIKNSFFEEVQSLENEGASRETLQELMGKGRAKKGIFEGDLEQGMLEIGQVASLVNRVESVASIFERLRQEYKATQASCSSDFGC